jgi:hypothetical protein
LDRGPGNPGPVVAIPIQNSGARWIATAPARKQENFVQSTVTRGTLSAWGVNRYSGTDVCVFLKTELNE